ncbi:hypothetical protein CI238_11641 [Colletotrichum incanum]|uniref:Uncharacterized protein n=1 Tax=Colletotrichum incanum TaxID=1573173 RepID=A0A161WAN4_COLIC|nr:hypothetical protein CI238_11641 [Colletotrichum incanum]OHW95273.1 hypothetical protein CSPAE12_06080 [Colletotrichum incanum]
MSREKGTKEEFTSLVFSSQDDDGPSWAEQDHNTITSPPLTPLLSTGSPCDLPSRSWTKSLWHTLGNLWKVMSTTKKAAMVCAGLLASWAFMLCSGFLLGMHHNSATTACPGSIHGVGRAREAYDFSGYQCVPLGATPEAAAARGCHWDDFSFHWWPADRYEDPDVLALMHEFADQEWHRYYEQEAVHEILEYHPMQTQAWVTRKEHLWHCAYTIMQTHLWMTKGFDPPVTYWHTVHCTKALMNAILESPPDDFMDIVMHGSAWPTHKPVIKPYYPCEEEGLGCISEPDDLKS